MADSVGEMFICYKIVAKSLGDESPDICKYNRTSCRLVLRRKLFLNVYVLSTMRRDVNKLSAYHTVSLCLLFHSLLWPVKVIFSSTSPKKSSKKMFSFNVQLTVNNSSFFYRKVG